MYLGAKLIKNNAINYEVVSIILILCYKILLNKKTLLSMNNDQKPIIKRYSMYIPHLMNNIISFFVQLSIQK